MRAVGKMIYFSGLRVANAWVVCYGNCLTIEVAVR